MAGNITLGGGNVTGTDYALGASVYPHEGVRVDNIVNLNSGGGNISMRGKSYEISTTAGAWGVGFWNLSTGSIASGAGAITLDGFSQSRGGTHNSGLYSYGALTITSANTTADAIQMIGKSIGNGGEAWGMEAESALSLLATGTGGGITVSSSQQNSANNYDIVFRGETNILAKSGPINLLGGQSGGIANGTMLFGSNAYLGSKASSAVLTSSSTITIQYDMFNFSNLPVKLATSGTLNWKPASTSFGQNVQTDWFAWSQNSQTLSGLTIGKSGNTRNVYLNNSITVAGPISVYGNYVEFTGNITSSADGDIFIKSVINGNNPSVYIGAATINKSAGTGTLTFQSSGRVLNYGTLSATGTGRLNVVMWSDYDNTNDDGGVSHMGTISTNSGDVWMGGSSSNGGSYKWNDLTVGDGPSIGSTNYNCNALDLFGPITTAGGDVLLWASNAAPNCGTNGIVSDGTRLINAGSGNITLIAPQTLNAIELTSTGVISLVPHAGGYASALTLGGTLTSGNFTFNTSHYNGLKINSLANSGLVIGNYSAHLSGVTAVTQGNSSNVTASSALSTKSLEIHGGAIALNENLNTTAGNAVGDLLLKASGDISLASAKSITTSGGDVILWSNSDNGTSNGSISLRNGSSITSGSNSVTGGSIWLGGGSDGATWNGLSVGSGYAVPGTVFTPSNGGSDLSGGIYLEGSSINSFGGHVKLAGDASTSFYGLLTYATNSIDSKAGKIELDGNASNAASASSTGVLFGIHDISIASIMNLTSSASDVAIKISAVGRGTGDAVALSGTLNTLSTGTGEISINGNAIGTGRSIVAGNYYSGILNAFANSGKITLNGGTKAVQVAVQVIGGNTLGPSKINLGNGASITNSSSDVFITADNIAIAASGIAVNSTGKVTIEPNSNSFASAITFPITNLSFANTVSGLTLGKSTNTQNITFSGATTIAGPITAFGGTIALNAALTATNSNINLTASTAATQTAAITANGLALNGAGTFTLNNTANNITTIAGGSSSAKIGSLYFVDAASGLEIGTVNPTGITSTGPIKIETLEGNITLSENLATDDTTADAIILNAGKTAAIGTATGGDIIVSGTPTVTYGTGGRAKLFSGRNSNSTGLTTLVGGDGNKRVSVDETTTTFSPVLANNTSYALYRAEDKLAATISNFNNFNKMFHDGSFTIELPTSDSTGAFSYTSSNTAVATISGTTVTILSAGTSTITANQATDVNYYTASATATLTVTSVSVLTQGGGISSTNLNYVNKYGQIGGSFGLSASGAIVNAKSPTPIISAGLVLNLDAGNSASYAGTGTTWTDLSGLGNNGILVGGPSFDSANNGNIVFDGIDDHVDLGNPIALSSIGATTNITVSAWVYYTAYGGGGQTYSVITVKGNPWTWLLENPSNTFAFRITAGGSDVNIADTSNHLLNTWYQVVGTYDGSNMKIYVNGILKNTRAQTGLLATNTAAATIGEWQGSYNFTGKIPGVFIYNRTLNAAEIQQNYNERKTRYGL